jgi:hypothetical protein
MPEEYKEYVIAGVTVKARPSAGGKFYDVLMPNGEQLKYRAEVFETVATEVKDGNR